MDSFPLLSAIAYAPLLGALIIFFIPHVTREMARSVDWHVRWGRLGSVFSLGVDLRGGKKPEDALAAIEALVPFVTSPLVDRAFGVALPRFEWWVRGSVSEISSLSSRATRLQDFVEYFGRADAAEYDLSRYRAADHPGAKSAGAAWFNGHKVAVMVRPVPGAPRAGRVVK